MNFIFLFDKPPFGAAFLDRIHNQVVIILKCYEFNTVSAVFLLMMAAHRAQAVCDLVRAEQTPIIDLVSPQLLFLFP